jgi:hypothetical protein
MTVLVDPARVLHSNPFRAARNRVLSSVYTSTLKRQQTALLTLSFFYTNYRARA